MGLYEFIAPALVGGEEMLERKKKLEKKIGGLAPEGMFPSDLVGSTGVAKKASNKTQTILSAPSAANVTKKALKG
jgi:hypothetical protein